jgi:hypothetical protein
MVTASGRGRVAILFNMVVVRAPDTSASFTPFLRSFAMRSMVL